MGNRPPSVAGPFLERVTVTPDADAYRYPVSPSSAEVPADWKSLSWTPAAERVYAPLADTAAGAAITMWEAFRDLLDSTTDRQAP
jgi:hypothetical protein